MCRVAGDSVAYPCMHWAGSKLHPGKIMTDNHKAGGGKPTETQGHADSTHIGGRSGRTQHLLAVM